MPLFSSFFTVLSVASSITGAFMNLRQAQAMKAYYDAQADIAKIQYESKRVQAKEQGTQALKNANRAIGSIVAKGAAGGVLTTTGSVMLGQTISLADGVRDLNTSEYNANLLNNIGAIQYSNLKDAGDSALQGGILSALSGLGTNLYSTYDAGLFSGFSQKTPQTFGTYTASDLDEMDRI
jgi:hypothetical protein